MATLVTHFKQTRLCLVDLIDVTLACEEANSKLVEVVTIANFDDGDRIGNSFELKTC